VFTPQLQLHEVRPEDYAAIVIPGGFDSHGYREDAYDSILRDHFQAIHGAGGWILTMCVGILPVVEAGLQTGKRATNYRFSRSEDRFARLQALGAITTEAFLNDVCGGVTAAAHEGSDLRPGRGSGARRAILRGELHPAH
jgi:putative intracellular protease/amidase